MLYIKISSCTIILEPNIHTIKTTNTKLKKKPHMKHVVQVCHKKPITIVLKNRIKNVSYPEGVKSDQAHTH